MSLSPSSYLYRALSSIPETLSPSPFHVEEGSLVNESIALSSWDERINPISDRYLHLPNSTTAQIASRTDEAAGQFVNQNSPLTYSFDWSSRAAEALSTTRQPDRSWSPPSPNLYEERQAQQSSSYLLISHSQDAHLDSLQRLMMDTKDLMQRMQEGIEETNRLAERTTQIQQIAERQALEWTRLAVRWAELTPLAAQSASLEPSLLPYELERWVKRYTNFPEPIQPLIISRNALGQSFHQLFEELHIQQQQQLYLFVHKLFNATESRSDDIAKQLTYHLLLILNMACENKKFRQIAMSLISNKEPTELDELLYLLHQLLFAMEFEKQREDIEQFRQVAIQQGKSNLITKYADELIKAQRLMKQEKIKLILAIQMRRLPILRGSSGNIKPLPPQMERELYLKIEIAPEENFLAECSEWLDQMKKIYPAEFQKIDDQFRLILDHAKKHFACLGNHKKDPLFLIHSTLSEILKKGVKDYNAAEEIILRQRNKAIATLYKRPCEREGCSSETFLNFNTTEPVRKKIKPR